MIDLIVLRCDNGTGTHVRCAATFVARASDVRIARRAAADDGWTIRRPRNLPVNDLCPAHSRAGT